jgi:hypothetical protein
VHSVQAHSAPLQMQSVHAQHPGVFAASPSFFRFTCNFCNGTEPEAPSALADGYTFILPDGCNR